MSTKTSSSTTYRLELKSYAESEDHLVEGNPEPSSRSQTLVYHVGNKSWWIKVTLQGYAEPRRRSSKRERREEYQDFVKIIDYSSLSLLEDTVTEVILEESSEGATAIKFRSEMVANANRFTCLIKKLKYRIQEDTSRVIYPSSLEYPSFQTINATDLLDQVEIADGVFQVSYRGDNHILKLINRPFYTPRDTDVIRKELENLRLFQGVPGIVQSTGIAVSPNPYMTSKASDQPLVVYGILLEFHGGGSLQKILAESSLKDYSWKRWPIQIGSALSRFHEAKRTHMDIKASNVVLDANGDAVLIDISGIGGITKSWLAPEVQNETSPFDLPFEIRQSNDTWAFGKLMSQIAFRADNDEFTEALKQLASDLTRRDIQSRSNLSEAISRLNAITKL